MPYALAQGYLPSNRDRHASGVERKRAEYRQCVALYFSSASTGRTDKEQALLRQVLVDVPRTSPGIPLFQTEFVQRVSTAPGVGWLLVNRGVGRCG